MTKWEYKHLSGELDEQELNALGEEGWELVSVHSIGYWSDQLANAVFKRPVPQPEVTTARVLS